MNENKLAKIFRLAMVAAILIALVAIATPVSAAGPTLNVNVSVSKLQVFDAPAGRAIYGDYVTGTVSVDMFSVDEQGGIWLRLGDGTLSLHHAIGDLPERWIPYGGTRDVHLVDIYTLPKVSFKTEQQVVGRVRLRIVEEPVEFDFAAGTDNFASAQGDLYGPRPQYLTVIQVPANRPDLLIYGVGSDCVARVNGEEQNLTVTSDLPIHGQKFTVVSGTCGVYSKDNLALDARGTKRSFSGVVLQANLGGLSALIALVLAGFGLYQAWRKRKLALVLQISAIALVIGGLALAAAAPVYAGPQPPGGPQGTPTPGATVTIEPTATPEATEVSSTPVPGAPNATLTVDKTEVRYGDEVVFSVTGSGFKAGDQLLIWGPETVAVTVGEVYNVAEDGIAVYNATLLIETEFVGTADFRLGYESGVDFVQPAPTVTIEILDPVENLGPLSLSGTYNHMTGDFAVTVVCPEGMSEDVCGSLQTGLIGPKGADGAQGPQGPEGVPGPAGPEGPKGADAPTIGQLVEGCMANSACVDAIADAVIAKQAAQATAVAVATSTAMPTPNPTPVPAEEMPPAGLQINAIRIALIIAGILVALGLIVILIRRRLSYEDDLAVEETPAATAEVTTLRRPGG